MPAFGLIVHQERPAAGELALEIAETLSARGHEVRVPDTDVKAAPTLARWACAPGALPDGLDVCISIGGDGTMLRAVHAVVEDQVPVLGINVGHLGYLTEVESERWEAALDRVLAGDYRVEERTTLHVELHREGLGDGNPIVHHQAALNDAVVEKLGAGHTVRVGVAINGRPFLSFATDGFIVATPTGSTAYNLSAGGPIISPNLAALVVTPVAPHLLFDRAMVLHPSEDVRLDVLSGSAALAIDGNNHGPLQAGDSVLCRAGPHAARLVSFAERDFRQILKHKFGLGGPDAY